MKFLLKGIREGLGRLIALVSWLTRPKKMQRTVEAQSRIETELKALSLYQFYACPFCIKVRRSLHRLNLPIEIRDAQQPGLHRNELAEQGGRVKVPCLRIDEPGQSKWLYESSDIIAYLEQRFG